ncbi:MAG TPA: DUF4124 domain-containing protein [Gammaproteobacteria bacterium]
MAGALASAALCAAGAHAQRVYRWVDENGVVHYGDRVPPQYAHADREILNERGVTVGFEEGALTDEERAEIERQKALEEERRRQQQEIARHDRMLLEAYLSVEEIEDLRDRRLEVLDSRIEVTEQYIANLRERLAALEREAARYKPRNEHPDAPAMPDNLRREIDDITASIASYEDDLARTRTDKEALRESFERDIERFKELKGADAG